MIWDSSTLMMLIDVAIIGAVMICLGLLYRHRSTLRGISGYTGTWVAATGVSVIVLVYLIDLFIMLALPHIVSSDAVMAAMTELHLNWNWPINLIGVVLIAAGFQVVVRQAMPRAVTVLKKLEEAQQNLSGEQAGRQLIAERLKISEARFRAIVDTVVDGVITIDERGVMQMFNGAAERIFGYRAQEVIGKNVNILMPDQFARDHGARIKKYIRTGEAHIIGMGREVEAGARTVRLSYCIWRSLKSAWTTATSLPACSGILPTPRSPSGNS